MRTRQFKTPIEDDRKFYGSELIRAAMGARRLRNEDLAKVAGVSADTIKRARRGDNLGIETLQKIAKALDLDITELIKASTAAA